MNNTQKLSNFKSGFRQIIIILLLFLYIFISDGKIDITPRIPDPLLDELMFSDIQTGGIWKPLTCIARQRTAIIIPYRDRKIHLYTLLHYLIPVLMRQLVEFRIFVIEQVNSHKLCLKIDFSFCP